MKIRKTFWVFSVVFFLNLTYLIETPNSIASKLNQISPEDSSKSIIFLKKQILKTLKTIQEENTKFGIAIYSLDKNEYCFKQNSDATYIPASLTKLVTSFSALNKFGSNFKVTTSIYRTGKIENRTLYGNLYIYGRGDALLSVSDIDYLVEKIIASGIKRITGGIIADDSFFDGQTDRFVYSGDADVVQKTQPITSLSLEQNIVTVIVTAGSIYGRYVNVQVIPASFGFKVFNSAKVARSLGNNTQIDEIDDLSKFGDQIQIAQNRTQRKPSQTSSKKLSVSSKLNQGFQEIYVSGNLEAGTSKTYSFFIENPPLVVAGCLKKRLLDNGVQVDGDIGIGQLPSQNFLVCEFSRNITEILAPMNKNSDNFIAEIVFKMIGAYDKKMTSNSKEAVRYVFNLLDSLNIPCLECKMYDGSGLSRRNRFTPESIVQILKTAKSNPSTAFFDTLLSIAGCDGTLAKRMIGTSAEGKVFAKTGTHSNASCLAGYLKTLDGELLAFAFMFNGEKVGTYKDIEDKLCIILTDFFYFNEIR